MQIGPYCTDLHKRSVLYFPLICNVVGLSGLEPPTSRLSGVRSNQLSYKPINGGDEGIRTPDPLLAGQVLSQLSYTPIFWVSLFSFFKASSSEN